MHHKLNAQSADCERLEARHHPSELEGFGAGGLKHGFGPSVDSDTKQDYDSSTPE
jgi:hypothetical protein